ncbi:MAG: sugar transferase [Candidatus Hydrogenedentes bacterium]|nr:sugar transferase [Candidatus Hydrogenedentota bacterium]
MPFHKQHPVFLTLTLAALDGVCIGVAYLIACFAALDSGQRFVQCATSHLPYLIIVYIVWYAAAIDQRLYLSRRSEELTAQLFGATKAVFVSLIFSTFIIAVFAQRGLERGFVIAFGATDLLLVVGFRLFLRVSIWDLRRRGYNFRQVLIVGANERSEQLAETILSHEQYGYVIEGFLEDASERRPMLERLGIPHLGSFEALEEILKTRVVDEVYITLPVRSYYEIIQRMAHLCEGVGVPVRLIADLLPLRFATSDIMRVETIPLLSLSAHPESHTQLAMVRAIDLTVSSLLLVALAPLFLLIALVIKLDSAGPVFVYQERVGQNQRRFKLVKFRTTAMPTTPSGAPATLQDRTVPIPDPPLTRAGRWIRRYGLDDVPQLFNVWRGQMSLVGPRPPVPSAPGTGAEDLRRRISVKPGMTGLLQTGKESKL